MNSKAFGEWADRTPAAGADSRRQAGVWSDEKAFAAETEADGFEEDLPGTSPFNLSAILGEKIRSIRNDLDAG